MKLTDIETEWSKHHRIDTNNLDSEAAEIPKLHGKFYNYYIREKLQLKKTQEEIKNLEHVLIRFYMKELTDEELEEYGLEYPDVKIMRSEVSRWVQNHKDMIHLQRKAGVQLEKVEFLNSILKQINQRSFQISNAIKFKIFQAGG